MACHGFSEWRRCVQACYGHPVPRGSKLGRLNSSHGKNRPHGCGPGRYGCIHAWGSPLYSELQDIDTIQWICRRQSCTRMQEYPAQKQKQCASTGAYLAEFWLLSGSTPNHGSCQHGFVPVVSVVPNSVKYCFLGHSMEWECKHYSVANGNGVLIRL